MSEQLQCPAPQVSFVVPCYNYARFLPEAIASIVAQTIDDWEAIIVDDGSPDETLTVARWLLAQYPKRRLRLLHQTNAGPAAARNNGALAARGEYLVFFDADDQLEPNFLEQTLAVARADPALGFVYTGMRMFGTDRHIWPSVPFDARRLALDNFIPQHCLVRRVAWQQVGGFDVTRSLRGFEDWDFWLRVVAAGWTGRHIAAPLVRYRRHGSSLTDAVRPEYAWDVRAQIIRKHPQIYGPRLVAWAQVRCARRGLPSAPQPLPSVSELGPDPAAPAPVAQASAAPQLNIPLRRRLVRSVPFGLRFRVRSWLRAGQLALRAYAPWYR
jgi:glycosyltransferase involved in cell wall biosynthesis